MPVQSLLLKLIRKKHIDLDIAMKYFSANFMKLYQSE